MKAIVVIVIVIVIVILSDIAYGSEYSKVVYLKGATLKIPTQWGGVKENDCFILGKNYLNTYSYLKVCKYVSEEENNYFIRGDDGIWEAVTDGIPVLADVNSTSKFTGMSAIVSCRIKDDIGYHAEQCFQAEIKLPGNIVFIFTGVGDSSLFNDYRKIFLSFEVK